MLTTEQIAKLERCRNYATRYEITARHPDGRTFLVCYTPRVSRTGLQLAMQNVGDRLVAALPVGENDEMTWHTQPRAHCKTSGWEIGFTGRTQRDAIMSGEMPFIAA
jgi:hypothetical protein